MTTQSPTTPALSQIRTIVADLYNVGARERPIEAADVGEELLLFDVYADGAQNLGLDSLDAIELSLRLGEQFGVEIPEETDPVEFCTPRRIAELIALLRQGTGA